MTQRIIPHRRGVIVFAPYDLFLSRDRIFYRDGVNFKVFGKTNRRRKIFGVSLEYWLWRCSLRRRWRTLPRCCPGRGRRGTLRRRLRRRRLRRGRLLRSRCPALLSVRLLGTDAHGDQLKPCRRRSRTTRWGRRRRRRRNVRRRSCAGWLRRGGRGRRLWRRRVGRRRLGQHIRFPARSEWRAREEDSLVIEIEQSGNKSGEVGCFQGRDCVFLPLTIASRYP